MSRRKGKTHLRKIATDPIYNDETAARVINFMMKDGKKFLAQRVFYQALSIVQEKESGKRGGDTLQLFHKALDQIKPSVEVRSRRVGGMTYQVPREVRPERMRALAIRWLVAYARQRKEKGMSLRLAGEIMDALKGQGGAMKKRNDTRRMADANKAFSHYRW